MLSEERTAVLCQQIASAIASELIRANIDWASFDQLVEPSVCIEAEFRDESAGRSGVEQRPLPGLTISQAIDLTGVISSISSGTAGGNVTAGARNKRGAEQSSGTIVPFSRSHTPVASHETIYHVSNENEKQSAVTEYSDNSNDRDHGNGSRMAISGLRPSCRGVPVVEDNTLRQIQVVNENFPKRRKAEAVGYALKPSTLDKLIIGIWEQLHGGSVDPVQILGEFMTPPLLRDVISSSQQVVAGESHSALGISTASPPDRQFNDTTVFCRKVTQASRMCRANDPKTSSTRHRKIASIEASNNFGWSEKELRNKMAVWRGYKEIKDAGGWAALVFAGMGIYRFCKYRVGFDNESMQRLRTLRPALEVAADTMNPNWRRLLSVVGEPPETAYSGHPHDWVICLDGSPPIPLRTTYLQWDPHFEYKHIEESIVDQTVWGGEDPRWKPPSSQALTRVSSLFVCQDCSNEQSDNPKLNYCCCFPSLFGCATLPPPPVQVFRTQDGRNNGLMALCLLGRGVAVGEFVGVITKGLRDVDVMESTTGSTNYQIWQGRQGNFTRFVNHSCNANAQYQRFTWLDTQRIILVSKGIEAGTEITVDYSDKYWRGLDKKCLCGKRNCRYSKNR
ncbi:hypothetical protein F5Y09DRAFT_356191 [Xylaria sp. FL1042]|nr:hypothetical protein F5Y09DRAFT_356191 [Xylaria sp. FL1042]